MNFFICFFTEVTIRTDCVLFQYSAPGAAQGYTQGQQGYYNQQQMGGYWGYQPGYQGVQGYSVPQYTVQQQQQYGANYG